MLQNVTVNESIANVALQVLAEAKRCSGTMSAVPSPWEINGGSAIRMIKRAADIASIVDSLSQEITLSCRMEVSRRFRTKMAMAIMGVE